jgi:hypothetical protein
MSITYSSTTIFFSRDDIQNLSTQRAQNSNCMLNGQVMRDDERLASRDGKRAEE